MKEVPIELRVRFDHDLECRITNYGWWHQTGAIYLLRCRRSSICKFGASVNPQSRIAQVIYQGRGKGYDLAYLWSIPTNGIGRLEFHLRRLWKPFRISLTKNEWVDLPDTEIKKFCSFGSVIWHNAPEPDPIWWDCVSGRFAG